MQANKFVVVADYFTEQVLGGAELSTQALIDTCPGDVVAILSRDIGDEDIEKYKDHYWIFTNVWLLKWGLIPRIVNTLKYSIVEYDFKYCVYRSPDMHARQEGMDCNCTNIVLDEFFMRADNIFFMSALQKVWYEMKMPFLKDQRCFVLSSLFDDKTLDKLTALAPEHKENCWAIMWSASSLKGFNEAVRYAETHKINYRIFKDLGYDEMLMALSKCEGLIYKPIGGDTCPRAVIEAKLMGLKCDLNYFVMHQYEEWFAGDVEQALRYLKNNKKFFWSEVKNAWNKVSV